MEISITFKDGHYDRAAQLISNTVVGSPLTYNMITPNTMRINGTPDAIGTACYTLGRMGVDIREVREIKPTFYIEGNVYVKRLHDGFDYEASFELQGDATRIGNGAVLGRHLGSLMDSDEDLSFLLTWAYFSSERGAECLKIMDMAGHVLPTIRRDAGFNSLTPHHQERLSSLLDRVLIFTKNKS